jgi:ribosomal protein L14E/L6E/L27E
VSAQKLASGTFRARINHDGVEVASKVFDRKRDADAWETAKKTELSAGTMTGWEIGRASCRERVFQPV